MNLKNRQLTLIINALTLIVGSLILNLSHVYSVYALRSITFPVIGPTSFSNDFNSPRSGGIHGATDIIANKMQKVVSPVDGVISFVPFPQPSYGYMISIRDSANYRYNFIHLNNDTPGTDNNGGGGTNAYAPDMRPGYPVVKGQHIGYVGDSGNAENTVSHLHFEIIKPNGDRENPYNSLLKAPKISKPALYPALPVEFLPYGASFDGAINIALGNFDLDQDSEQITTPGAGGGPYVKTFDNDNNYLGGFFAYKTSIRCGIDVATGDVDGDGIDEIITGPGPGCGPHIRIFELDGTIVGGFFAYRPEHRSGVRVAAGDVDGDGIDEIITGPGPGGGPHVQVRALSGAIISSFFAYNPANRDGIDVASANVSGLLEDEIITTPGPGGGPQVKIFNYDGTIVSSFFAYDSQFRGGVRVSAGDIKLSTSYAEIVTVPASAGGPNVRTFDAAGAILGSTRFIEDWWRGGYDIAGGYDLSKATTGVNRRGSVRFGTD